MAKIALICMYDPWALGLRTISNALTEAGHEASIIHLKLPAWSTPDYFAKNTLQYQVVHSYGSCNSLKVNHHNTDVKMWTYSEISLMGDLLEELSPDIIGISTRCVYEVYLEQIFEQIKRVKGAVTIAGGHDASFRPELYLQLCDLVCVGEGEEAMVKISNAIDHKKDFHNINNLVYKDKNKIITNVLATPNNQTDYFYTPNMSEVKHYLIEENNLFPTDMFLMENSNLLPSLKAHYYTMMGRGCVGKCTFCSAGHFRQIYTKNQIRYKSRRLRPIENIIKETKSAKEKGYQEIYFLDSFFLAKKEYLLSFFEAYRDEVGIPFFAQFEPEQILAYPEILDEAERAGFKNAVIGIQSGSEQINKKVFRRNTPHKKLIKFANMMSRKKTISIDYHFITHNPFETPFDYEETIKLIKNLPKENTNLVLRPLYAFKNTAVEQMISQPDVAPINKELHDKLLVLYLIRYCVPDLEFENVAQKFDSLSFLEIKKIYSDLKKQYKTEKEWHAIGEIYLNNKQYAEAAKMYSKALDINAAYAPALYSMGRCMFLLKNFKKASKHLEILKNIYIANKNQSINKDKIIWYTLGECYYHLKMPEKVIENYSVIKENSQVKNDDLSLLALKRINWAYSVIEEKTEEKIAS